HGFYKTTDGGATWTSITTVNDVQYGADFSRGQAWYDLSLEVAPDDPNKVVVGGINVFRSLDGGASWTQVSHWYGGFGLPYVHADQHGVAFRPGLSDHVLFSNDGGVYATENLSAPAPTPVDRNTGYNVTQFYAGAIAPEAGSHVMLAGAQDNGTQRFDAAGIDATVEVRGGDGGFTFIDQTNSLIGIASYVYNNFYRSVNGGHSFPLTLLSENTGYFINYADYDDREDILFTTRDATTIWRVSGVSTTPSPQQVPMSLGSRATHFRVSPYSTPGTTTLFIGTEGGRVYKVTDAHATPVLTQINAGAGMAGTISCIEIGESENHLLVTISNYNAQSVWETVDGGTTWMNRTGNYPRVPVRWALFNPNDRRRVILATEAGVWETTDITVASPEWTPAPSFPTVRVDMLQWRESDQTVMAATHGRGVYTATFLQGTVANEGGPEQPGATHTLAASPNPFRNQSEVTLSVARAQRVRAEVFAIDGRRVAVLLDEDVAAGQRVRLSLDGQALPAGAYVVAVQGEDFRDQVRVTRVR
ncbi:MAG TPA: hypothetical protein VD962_00985, partial [Rubricoccaceae bacterium]|nr:hypothetical protein [Rubricoccaceae bacterium]